MKTATAIKQITAMGFHPFHHEGQRDVVQVSAEYGDMSANYYADFAPWINPTLERWAAANGLHFEWCNPGCIAAYRN